MASFDQLQCSLALSDSALAHDQNALAEYIDQHAVDGDHRGKLDIQPADDFSHENGSRFVYRKGRYLITIAQLQNFRSRNHLRGENDTWDLAAYKLFKRADALALFKMLQIRELYITDDLHTLIGKMLIVTGQLQCRTVDIRVAMTRSVISTSGVRLRRSISSTILVISISFIFLSSDFIRRLFKSVSSMILAQ